MNLNRYSIALPIKYKQEENHETAISKLTKGYTKHTYIKALVLMIC